MIECIYNPNRRVGGIMNEQKSIFDAQQLLFLCEQLDNLTQDEVIAEQVCFIECTTVGGLATALKGQLLERLKI